jgi:hypothetical protein
VFQLVLLVQLIQAFLMVLLNLEILQDLLVQRFQLDLFHQLIQLVLLVLYRLASHRQLQDRLNC